MWRNLSSFWLCFGGTALLALAKPQPTTPKPPPKEKSPFFVVLVPGINASFFWKESTQAAFAPEVFMRTHYFISSGWGLGASFGYTQSTYGTQFGTLRLDFLDFSISAQKKWQQKGYAYYFALGPRLGYRLSGLLETKDGRLYSFENNFSAIRWGLSTRVGILAQVAFLVFITEVDATFYFSKSLQQTTSPVAVFQEDQSWAMALRAGLGISF